MLLQPRLEALKAGPTATPVRPISLSLAHESITANIGASTNCCAAPQTCNRLSHSRLVSRNLKQGLNPQTANKDAPCELR